MQEKIILTILSLFTIGCFSPEAPFATIGLTDFTETRGEPVSETRNDAETTFATTSTSTTTSTTIFETTDVISSTTSVTTTNSNGPICGNGILEVGEQCDNNDFGGTICENFGKVGSLTCVSCAIDISSCVDTVCGDGIIEGGEHCEGSNLNDQTCITLGNEGGGELKCGFDCKYDTSSCYSSLCGNCVLENDEECDPCLFTATQGVYCESEETDFGKCVLKFTEPVMYSWFWIEDPNFQTPNTFDQEEADLLCKIFIRDLDAISSSYEQIKGWSSAYNYFDRVGQEGKSVLLKSAKSLTSYPLYYKEYDWINNGGLDPAHLQWKFKCVQHIYNGNLSAYYKIKE